MFMFSSLVIWTVRDSCNRTTYFPLWEQAWLTWAYRRNSRCGRAECIEPVSTHGHSSAGFTDWNGLDVSLPSVGTSCWREYWSCIYISRIPSDPKCGNEREPDTCSFLPSLAAHLQSDLIREPIGCYCGYLAATGNPIQVAHFRQTSRKLDTFLFPPHLLPLSFEKNRTEPASVRTVTVTVLDVNIPHQTNH